MGLGNQLIIILRVDKELRVICGIRVLNISTVCTVFHVFAASSIIARSENKKKSSRYSMTRRDKKKIGKSDCYSLFLFF